MHSSLRPFLSSAKTLLFRRPRSELSRLIRWGPRSFLFSGAWQRQMAHYASHLPRLPNPDSSIAEPLEVWFLTGNRFWYQTLFCAWSLAKYSHRRIVVHLLDDGTLQREQEQLVRHFFPLGLTRWRIDLLDQLEQYLPTRRFPILRQRWLDYVNIRKLTDVHLGGSGYRLVLDSDMLFFSPPTELLAWCDAPFGACLMHDCEESYGYSRELMARLAGTEVPPLLNVGICGLSSESIDWDELESWCRSLLDAEGTSYYLEQALVAMLAARMSRSVMPAERYITFPSRKQVSEGQGVLHHYVSDSKPLYFGKAWRVCIAN